MHGAWHGSWCWAEVERILQGRGVGTVTVDNPSVHAAPATLHDDADNVLRAIDAVGGPVVLVGHSYGGAIVTDAGAHPAVAHVVYVAAFVLDDGESVITNALTGGEAGNELEPALRFEDDVAYVDPVLAGRVFYNDCSDAAASVAVRRLGPQSMVAFAGIPRAVAWRSKPSTYVLCSEDRAVAPALQRSAAARTGAVVELAAGHSPFLSRPDDLADLLERVATEVC